MGTSRTSSTIKILVTVYLSTSYLNECQFYRTEICDHSGRKPTNGSKRHAIGVTVNRDRPAGGSDTDARPSAEAGL